MAEERLIDDDKDRKYKIRKNADGEDELIIDDTPDDEEESDIPVFNVPVYEEDDEEAALLTPEQLAEREKAEAEEKAAHNAKLEAAMHKAQQKLEEGDFEGATYAITQADDFADENGEFYCLKLKCLTRNFTDFLSCDKCVTVAEGVKSYANEEQKQQLREMSDGLKGRIAEVESKLQEIHKKNEDGKEERRSVFAEEKKRTSKNFLIAAVPFFIALILAISFGSVIFAAENGTYVILTIVFGVLALIGLVFTLITANKLWTANRRVKLNERDNTTQVGRDYLKIKEELEQLKGIYASFDNDLS